MATPRASFETDFSLAGATTRRSEIKNDLTISVLTNVFPRSSELDRRSANSGRESSVRGSFVSTSPIVATIGIARNDGIVESVRMLSFLDRLFSFILTTFLVAITKVISRIVFDSQCILSSSVLNCASART
jgi:hypothetical protein